MLDGGQFVEAVSRLGYPGASALKGEDFDWLFDSPEHRQFLRFFCSSVNKSNVLTPEEVRAFRALRASGKPVLDEAALGEVLKACQAAPARGDPASALSWLEEADVAQLAEELQALRRERKLKARRLKKLQVLAAGRADAALRLASRQEDGARRLRETVAALGAENAETNSALQALTDEVKRLASYLRVELPQQEPDERAPPPAPGPPVFLSQLSLDPYLHQEELNTKALALFTQKQFFKGISDMVESSSSENFQLLDLSSCSEDDERVVEARRTEMARLQWAHVVAQHQLLQAQAEEHGVRAGLQWLTDTLRSKIKPCASVQALQTREAGFRHELQGLEGELQALSREAVPATLRESARLLNVPVVRGDFDLQVARQEYYTSRQDQVCGYLLRQRASFELLHLAQELELRKGRQLHRELGELAQRLESRGTALKQRLHVFSQPELALAARPSSIIGTKDAAFSRLYKILECGKGPSGEREQPFKTFEGLEQVARDLREELRSAREALAAAAQEQAFTAARLEGHCETLRGATYSGLQQLVLTPQVCAAPGQELCPSSQELRGQLQELESQLNSLNRLMQDMVGDIRGKRAQLERSWALKRERDLYVYFHLDEKLLRKVLEELEARVAGRSSHA
ncbi:hypothetical protein MATL_G00196800 [Megalops atlanticus]|uniref:HAUS augmin-like complex subunit 3 N-terminal domain-containing protein n=1 Tax=Megalops atlanticus TaxID=7932 RepID=A0A9D3PJW5_MEGAT|nr:hypothetical protein MATL_G00196800 [Megalops atlanticus]